MYIKNGVAYADELQPSIKVNGVRPLDNYKLWIRFSNGETKVFDFNGLLNSPVFSPLKDKTVFNSVYIDYGITVWNNGNIDIAPEYLYEKGIAVGGAVDA